MCVNNFTLVLGVANFKFYTCFAGQPSPVMARQRQHDSFSFKGRLSQKLIGVKSNAHMLICTCAVA